MALGRSLVIAAFAASASCSGQTSDPAQDTTSAPASEAPIASGSPSIARPRAADPNPLQLPGRKLDLAPGRQVFAVPEAMLANAKWGSTLVLTGATVRGFDADLLVVENDEGATFRVHSAYAIVVPEHPNPAPSEPVVAELGGQLKHAIAKRRVKDKIVLRFLEGAMRTVELPLQKTRLFRQIDGLLPGNYAAYGDGETLRHVLLVSPIDDGKKWLVLGFGGAAMLADAAALEPIPVKWNGRAGATVLAEHLGTLRKGTVASTPETGVFTVKYERAGRPVTLGWGWILPQGK